ncbi:HTH domain-containing protein [Lysinibacillus capsici]|uniref:HTH domain-containing protein n=1 Tax=Lysinibacillus capsici TaxID=2115968 RepID=UPI0032DEDF89
MREYLTNDELRVNSTLEGLGDSESLTGSQIMERLMIKDRRYFHQIIFDLRSKGMPVVSKKNRYHSGYRIARTKIELASYLQDKEHYIDTHKKIIEAMRGAAETIF